MDVKVITRKELYDLVWTVSITSLTDKYQIPFNTFKKICAEMQIPIPASGYWSKLKFGKQVKIVDLPGNYIGNQQVDLTLFQKAKSENRIMLPGLSQNQKSDLINNKQKLKVSLTLNNPDKLIIAARESLKKNINRSNYYGVITCEKDELNIRVSPGNVGRALLFMDSLIKVLRSRGCDFDIKNNFTTHVLIMGEEVKISLKEKLKKVIVKDHWNSQQYHATGILTFRIEEGWRIIEWKDGKRLIEDQFDEIIAGIEKTGRIEYEARLLRKKEAEEKIEKKRIQKELEERQDNELAFFKDLIKEAKRRDTAVMLRNHIDQVEKNAFESKTVSPELKEWFEWARRKADWYDPFIESTDDLLDGADRNSLKFLKRQ